MFHHVLRRNKQGVRTSSNASLRNVRFSFTELMQCNFMGVISLSKFMICTLEYCILTDVTFPDDILSILSKLFKCENNSTLLLSKTPTRDIKKSSTTLNQIVKHSYRRWTFEKLVY